MESDKEFKVMNINTMLYTEFPKQFNYGIEKSHFWKMIYIDRGAAICTFQNSQFTLKSGDCIFYAPNEFCKIMGDAVHTSCIITINFACDARNITNFLKNVYKLTQNERTILSMLFDENLSGYRYKDKKDYIIRETIKPQKAPFASRQLTKNLLEILLIMLSRHKTVTIGSETKNYYVNGAAATREVKVILDFMYSRLYGRLQIRELAAELHQSESYVKKVFAQYYSGGVIHYFHSLKIKEARRLIREENLSMEQISDMLAFDNQSYFSRCFKKFSDMTPSEYKNSVVK